MAFSHPDLETKFIFRGETFISISSDYVDTVTISLYNSEDKNDLDYRTAQIEPDEIDLLISTLNLYKNRILKGRKEFDEDV